MDHEPLVTPVNGSFDISQFVADIGFVRDEKAVTQDDYAKYADQLEPGDLLISGTGANFELDRENEAFAPGAFDRGLKTFLEGEGTLAYHHKHDQILGRVLHAERVEGKGVHIVARVDNQPESSPLRHIYEQVKKGTLNALSCGGFFKRAMVDGVQKIVDVDLTEWSITGVPVGRGANFAVVAGKALTAEVEPEVLPTPEPDVTVPEPELPTVVDEISEEDLAAVENVIDELSSFFEKISERRKPKTNTEE